MPLLLSVLRNADGPGYRKFRVKAMEWRWSDQLVIIFSLQYVLLIMLCHTAIAVGRDVFRPDANTLVELMIRIQSMLLAEVQACSPDLNSFGPESPVDLADTQLGHYLIAAWVKVCQAMGPEFEPYLPVVMPALLTTASAKAGISVYGTLLPFLFSGISFMDLRIDEDEDTRR